jgi:hypothetical protein
MDKQSVSERELKVQVLSLEYQTLRAAIMNQTAASYQFLGLATTAAAILATGAGHLSFSSGGGWFLAILAGGIFVFGAGSYRLLRMYVAFLSQRVAVIEEKINNLVPGEERLLSWESDRQNRSRSERWLVGHQIPKRYKS